MPINIPALRQHTEDIPELIEYFVNYFVTHEGGILFYIAVVLFFIVSNFKYPYFFVAISSIALVSFVDDVKTLSAKVRLPFQFFAIALVIYQIDMFHQPWFMVGLVTIIGVAFINMYNFMDGINGITGVYSLVVLSGFLVLNYQENIVSKNLMVFVMAAIIVFGYYNFRKKARMFAGDIGSISLAMVILFLGLKFIMVLHAPVIILMVAVYGVDSGITILYRLYLKEPVMEAHRHHIYQKLVDKAHWSHLKVSGVYALVQLLINVVVIYSYQLAFTTQLGIVTGVVLGLIICYKLVFNSLKKK
jgi:UDP-N-acetylmuramyl pentapeptide phosphotransferase/UDP-N-acetylglucosamine-1-phosphate transferase